ncbi:hypothetical protein QBC38DRAFT_445309 [Podospora fimiseda]|uniref:2EXR domain-containing protein n=1 Tax=Podospora fimiseda TaxID=252190 RepID=A0AAN7BLZ4_9PEZI|nr:hypothetical protein QBC38DRAFT_445309 [Podospora fimiseda]
MPKIKGVEDVTVPWLMEALQKPRGQIPMWGFLRFPDFPIEIQIMIWKAALGVVATQQPRIIAVHTMVPAVHETHLMVRTLAQTCTTSRQVALPFLKICKQHEPRHFLAIPFPRLPDQNSHYLTADQLEIRSARFAAFQGNLALVNLNPAAAHFWGVPPTHPEVDLLAPHRRAPTADETRAAAKYDTEDDELIDIYRNLNPLHNHIHADTDYFLFTNKTISQLDYGSVGFVNILAGAKNIIAPASAWYHHFGGSTSEVELPDPTWFPSTMKKVVMILPICSDIRDFDRAYGLPWSNDRNERRLSLVRNDNLRWSECSEIPSNLLYFWSDEEMDLFVDSFKSRLCYFDSEQPPPGGPVPRIWVPVNTGDTTPPVAESDRVTRWERYLASRSSKRNPFDEWKDTHLLFGLWHIWTSIQALHASGEEDGEEEPAEPSVPSVPSVQPSLRFAHIRGMRAYDFLAEAQGKDPERAVLNWQKYVPRYSTREIHQRVMNQRFVQLDMKRRSKFMGGADGIDPALERRLIKAIPKEVAKKYGVPGREAGGWSEMTNEQYEVQVDRFSQFACQADHWKKEMSMEHDEFVKPMEIYGGEKQERMWQMCERDGEEGDPMDLD